MSIEFIFYPAFKDKLGKYVPLLYDAEKEPASVFWRSESFIDNDYFGNDNFLMVKRSDLGDDFQKHFGDTGFKDRNGEPLTYIYEIPMKTLQHESVSGGIISGYAPIDMVEEYYKTEYKMDFLKWNLAEEIVPAEFYAELPENRKRKYMKFYALDYFGSGYICRHLLEILNDIYVPYEWKGEICYLMNYSF